MKVEYDKGANATYITLKKGGIGAGEVSVSKETKDSDIVLDYDKNGYLIGIEVLNSGVPDCLGKEGPRLFRQGGK